MVQNAAIVCVLECLGETCSPPRDRLRKRAAAQRLTAFRPRPGLCRRPELVERREQVGPCLRRNESAGAASKSASVTLPKYGMQSK